MATPPIDLNERRRQDALIGLGVLDTLPEPVFDAITSAAAEACGVPIALVSLVDADRQWFKSNIGLPGVEQTSRDVAFCDHAIRGSELLEVPSAEHDARFAANPLVTGEPHIRFYAGAPIELPGGERVGTVCVIDREPRQLTQAQRALLVGLGRVASAALVDRQRQLALSRQVAVSEARYRAIVEDQSELISLASPDGVLSFVNQAYARHYGTPAEQMVGRRLLDFVAAADRAAVASRLEDLVAGREIAKSVNRTRASTGDERWVEWTNRPLVDEAGRCTAIHSVGRDVTEQHLAELRLREALHEKDTLLKEVYHRVKNNLQLVQSLLNLQHRGTADASAQAALADSARRIRAMALVHEKLYQSHSLASITLGAYARELLRHIGEAASTAARGIEIRADIADVHAPLDAAIPFGLLLNELVFNALEHAFEGRSAGRVDVSLDLQEGVPLLRVQDDGAGLEPGFSCSQATGMGLHLAMSLATQLGGSLQARAGRAGGAEFIVPLPGLVRQAG
ncbi:sensor histidine kinase [Piscinibacter defluvii]|uniref:sensor histidine kinase n=1 Tax=Piscinibacter defluvii TaxID=1796922 RepID=UPI0013E2D3DB|nr:histidine kinase dimerization/phosphoacceptor domain -containing protein [Piscinibacter defluvii]